MEGFLRVIDLIVRVEAVVLWWDILAEAGGGDTRGLLDDDVLLGVVRLFHGGGMQRHSGRGRRSCEGRCKGWPRETPRGVRCI